MRTAGVLAELGQRYGQRPSALAGLDLNNPMSLAFDYEVTRIANPAKE